MHGEDGIEKFSEIAHREGLFIVQAHPYRDGKCFPTPEYVDAIEVYNSNPRHEDNSEKSELLAHSLSLPVSAGSDAHREEDVAKSGIETELEIKTSLDFITAVKEGKLTVIRSEI